MRTYAKGVVPAAVHWRRTPAGILLPQATIGMSAISMRIDSDCVRHVMEGISCAYLSAISCLVLGTALKIALIRGY
jgi:hypothetical protein